MSSIARRPPWLAVLPIVLALALAGCSGSGADASPAASRSAAPAGPSTAASSTASATAVPKPDHTVVVVFENKQRSDVLGSGAAPYLDSLARTGADMQQSFGNVHPSQPNYLAMFSGSLQGVTSNDCPQDLGPVPNLGRQLLDAGLTFTGYAESLPSVGYTGCVSGQYQRKHNPWVNFSNIPSELNQPFSSFPSDFTQLPTVAFVTPNMCSDMHDCSVSDGDAWARANLDRYAQWARTHNSLLVVTFDENSGGDTNPIPTILVGQRVRAGGFDEQMNQFTLLRTIEDAYGLDPLEDAATVEPLHAIWTTGG